MYQRLYEEIAEEASDRIREDERRAFRHCIGLMAAAQKAGVGSRESVEAIFFLTRLWSVLMEDLAHPENALPVELKARLISIGIWMLKNAENIRMGQGKDFRPLIDVSESIYDGLKGRKC